MPLLTVITQAATQPEAGPTFSVIWAAVATAGSALCGAVALLFKSNEKAGAKLIEALTADKAVLITDKVALSVELKELHQKNHDLALKAVEVITEIRLSVAVLPDNFERHALAIEKIVKEQHERTREAVTSIPAAHE